MTNIDVTRRSIGMVQHNGMTEAVVWAPEMEQVHFCSGGKKLIMHKDEPGYWKVSVPDLQEGALYNFLLNNEKELPDPASLSQPLGVHGASQFIRPEKFQWTDQHWKNPDLEDYIIYELHTGSFTGEGTFSAMEEKLDHLVSLGVNAIEIMPVAQFPGDRNWGYDGVFPFAVQHSYGGAEGLQHLVNTCHAKKLAVILDVVYNHFGPEGNYLPQYGPYIISKYQTPWGGAINFDDTWCNGVRHYFIENALMWLRDFHIDALRLDAVHAIRDIGPKHILLEIREYVDELMHHTGRKHHLIAELDLNDPRYINASEKGGYGLDAQWIDEFHHALRVTAGGERNGYYSDFNGIEHLAKAYKDAYVYDGQFSSHRKKDFGIKTENEGRQFVVFSQNHDQAGNRMLGEKTSMLFSFEMQKLMAAAVMVSPYLPMLFMGEEWSDPSPFLYFVSHTDPELAEAVRQGRKREFAEFHRTHPGAEETPDPMDEETFRRCKLQWQLLTEEPHATMLKYYQSLIALRKSQPALYTLSRKQLHVEAGDKDGVLGLQRWTKVQHVLCYLNFSERQQFVMPPSNVKDWKLIFDSASPLWKGPRPAADTISGGKPGNPMLTLQPESIVIYTDQISG